MGFGRPGGLEKSSYNQGVDPANSGFSGLENKQQIRRVTNPRTVVSGWKNSRWAWKDAVCRAADLTDGAKLLAVRIVDSFAHHETAFCNPSIETMAEALGKSGRSIQRALVELQAAGWIRVDHAKGRGRTSKISFLTGPCATAFDGPEKVTRLAARHADQQETQTENLPERETDGEETRQEKVTAASPFPSEKVTTLAKKGDSRVTPILKPKNNQNSRAVATEALSRPAPHLRKFVAVGSDFAAEWDKYHDAKGFQPLAVIGLRVMNEGVACYDLPFNRPPKADAPDLDRSIALKFAAWATAEAEARHDH